MNPIMKKSLLVSSLALALGAPAANAALVANVFGPYSWVTDRANFTMLDPTGYMVGGTNDVSMKWDGNAYNASSDYTGPGGAANVTASSTTPFFGMPWSAHDIQVFLPGSYSFDVTAGADPADFEVGFQNVTVGAGQIGMHMLFDWNITKNIDVFVVANQNSVFGSGIANSSNPSGCAFGGLATQTNCLWDGPGYAGGFPVNKPAGSTVWMLASTDGDGDGVMGISLPAGGPFHGFNANFNANMNPIPVPAAVWLFGSGLLGLLGVARRRKATA
ncbi:hypothetical protein SCL_1582 [Sulfuricaulis limicola]|uniref:Uncharacterized protein n=1 Tax=Sulfuricaulis limicola TaxID=1620215 RepID=A0A1B4XGI5_9GAMM|nr:hypothetical protein [Sulfuricaulis limicola]BAV33887.1 hypothetical protein SCL_1582 [Sulfuricaulis limicola]